VFVAMAIGRLGLRSMGCHKPGPRRPCGGAVLADELSGPLTAMRRLRLVAATMPNPPVELHDAVGMLAAHPPHGDPFPGWEKACQLVAAASDEEIAAWENQTAEVRP
jgi:hypothetical protein